MNGKNHVMHIPRKTTTWKTECGLDAEKVNCISPGEAISGEDRCRTCVRLAQRPQQSA